MQELLTRHGYEPTGPIRYDSKDKPYFMERKVCARCGGDGIWKGRYRGVCYGCGGQGDKGHKKVRLYTADQRAKLDAAQAKRDAKRQAKAEAAHALYLERRDFRREVFDAENPGVDFYLSVISESDFGKDLAEKLEKRGSLTPKQVDAVVRSAIQEMEKPEAEPVPEGRVQITGRVIKTKNTEGQYGYVYKMLVVDDRGFRLWGSNPQRGMFAAGDYVTFTAKCEPSEDDPEFGFYSRPTKAEILHREEEAA